MAEKPSYEELEKRIRDFEKTESDWHLEKRRFNRQRKTYRLLMDISTNCINIPIDTVENAIQVSLRQIGKFITADRAYLFKYDLRRGL